MSLSMMFFVTGDTLVKYLSADLNLGQVIAARGFFALIIISSLMQHKKVWKQLSVIKNKWVISRHVSELGATLFFFTGLLHTPLGNTSAIMQALPLTVTMGAALFLSEKVGWRRWTAIFIGFIGVIIVIRPGVEGFNFYSLFILVAVFFITMRDLFTRKMGMSIPLLPINFIITFMIMLLGLVMMFMTGGWQPMNLGQLAIILFSSGLIILANQSIMMAMREGDIAFISPFRYSNLIAALMLGYLFFGEIPDKWMILGSLIVVLTGIYTFHRERITAKQAADKPENL